MDKIFNIVDALLDQTMNNEIRVTIKRGEDGWADIVVSDNLSEIVSVHEFFMDKALHETVEQLQDFVDGLNDGSE